MKRIMLLGMILVVSGIVYAGVGQIEILYQTNTGEIRGWNKSATDFGNYKPNPDESVGVFNYNQGEVWEIDSVRIVGSALVPVIRPTPTPVPDLLELINQQQAQIDDLETRLTEGGL